MDSLLMPTRPLRRPSEPLGALGPLESLGHQIAASDVVPFRIEAEVLQVLGQEGQNHQTSPAVRGGGDRPRAGFAET